MTFLTLTHDLLGFIDRYVIPLIFTIAFIGFLIGIFRYFFFEGEENRQKGRQFALWSIITLVLMFSIWGVINLLLASLRLAS